MTIKDFFVKLVTKELSLKYGIAVTISEVIECVELSKILVSVVTQVSLNCGIIELTSSIGVYIHYQLKSNNDTFSDLVLQLRIGN